MADVLSVTFTDSSGASITRTHGPDLSTLGDPALWDQRVKDTLNALYEERHGAAPPSLGTAVQSLVDRWYEWLRGEEKRIRTEAAVEAAEVAEDEVIPGA